MRNFEEIWDGPANNPRVGLKEDNAENLHEIGSTVASFKAV